MSTHSGMPKKKLKWQLPKFSEDSEEVEFTTPDGGPNLAVWWRLIHDTAKRAVPGGSIPAEKDIPRDLARIIGAVWGLAHSLNATKRAVPREKWQNLGLHDAEDLLTALVDGREHPALRYWLLDPERKMGSLPSELEARTKIIAAVRSLSKKSSDGRVIGITRARRMISMALRAVPTFEGTSPKTIENWETVQLPKVFAIDRSEHKRARSFVEDSIRACQSKAQLDEFSISDLLEFAKIAASDCVSPSIGLAQIE